ncbi:symmetrical bis(5'-nucleosyl)-tetraphosphatase [Shewanella sp. JM162201]|uniref:bis(5'-nucleosyl)-tetraphosphatase (symmetrical) n=1 Tax=Shewanella jiangmenensis TaxID=2837387 RepID=A0ABS5V137_9GAMM|nr:symmetrical bis(5'-nucleosyl)-tetraphosphatase [Shewanella jiangmenensis]MBT1443633.1 symmetrical bis(5'-nucleosyl)-tetraphosphatase [Shewanella jiangmenensis]
MARYFVGDIQGCYEELMLLLLRVDFHPSRDELWSVGDMVARGPESHKVLGFMTSLGDAAKVVLGNHDLHLLAITAGLKRAKPSDKLKKLLESKHLPGFIDWVRHQPLMREIPEHKLIMTHAGVPPQWDLATLRTEAGEVSKLLQSDGYLSLIGAMYTDEPEAWDPTASGFLRHRYCIDALTRMRYLHPDGRLDFACKKPPSDCTTELKPWFELPSELDDHTLVFGHWAALMGHTGKANRIALDTGCCWGEDLTLWQLESGEKITQKKLNLG